MILGLPSGSNATHSKFFSMKTAKVLHNPTAGEGETSGRELLDKLASAGFKCSYSSTKHFRWENIETEDLDLLILAGGDGTVRKIAEELLARKVIEKRLPLGLLPLGTANNIARTLGLDDNVDQIIAGWGGAVTKKFDVGRVTGLGKPTFFLESFGYGLFPRLMQEMKKQKKNQLDDPKEKLEAALKILKDLILSASPKKCKLAINDKDYSGEFLLIEVMNIRSIGPNLNLAPQADPGDGEFEVVLITEHQREALVDYVEKKIQGTEVLFDFPILKARELTISWDGKHVHVDDEYHKLETPSSVQISVREGLLEFLLPAEELEGT